MEDLSKEMMPGKSLSPKIRTKLDKEKNEARKRIIDRGIIHFRADEEFMVALLELAAHLKIAPGTLCRRIVWEHLQSIRSEKQTGHVPASPEISEALSEIRGELREIHTHLLGKMKKQKNP